MAKKKHPDTPEEFLSGIYSPAKMQLVRQSPEVLSVGERLRRERILRKMTIEELAEFMGISPAYLGSVERGKRPLSNRLMKRLHDRLGISYDYLLEGMTISGNMISQYVRESEIFTTHHNLNVLLGVCSPDELDSCYNLVHTYLTLTREQRAAKAGKTSRRNSRSSSSHQAPAE